VGVETLAHWVRRSPLEHPLPFVVMLLVTGLMLFDFAWFREQTCIVACPYGRFQAVMLDRDSLIVSYDPNRGEPRGKLKERRTATGHGDCIDCGMCTDTCPTGIDIREGLQLECIACTQCIDACDGVMQHIGKPPGLIRLSSQAAIAGQAGRRWRLRVILYSALMLVLTTVFLVVFCNKKSADVTILQGFGQPYSENAQGEIINQVRVVIENRSGRDAIYKIEIAADAPAHFVRPPEAISLPAGQTAKTPLAIVAPAAVFQRGLYDMRLHVSDDATFTQDIACRLLGPVRRPAETPTGTSK
jgi:cytochrome c oxidase accessory protein FixG